MLFKRKTPKYRIIDINKVTETIEQEINTIEKEINKCFPLKTDREKELEIYNKILSIIIDSLID